MAQLSWKELIATPDPESNSMAVMAKHMAGNMKSRWTDFFSSDGEKTWRNREREFEADFTNRAELEQAWEEGWQCLFNVIDNLEPSHLNRIIHIRNQGHTVVEAVQRQLGHYSYHVGQMVFLAKHLRGSEWQSLSIPKGQSSTFNKAHFDKPQERGHFTDSEQK